MNIELWLAGFLFTMGLVSDEDDKVEWYHIALTLLVWPLILGAEIRKVE